MKISLANIGKHHVSEETRKKLSLSAKNRKDKHIRHSKEHNKKIGIAVSKTAAKKKEAILAGLATPRKPLSEEHRKKIAIAVSAAAKRKKLSV